VGGRGVTAHCVCLSIMWLMLLDQLVGWSPAWGGNSLALAVASGMEILGCFVNFAHTTPCHLASADAQMRLDVCWLTDWLAD
jgi:hypothetical protein